MPQNEPDEVDPEIDQILTTISRAEARFDDLKKRADLLNVVAINGPLGTAVAELAKATPSPKPAEAAEKRPA